MNNKQLETRNSTGVRPPFFVNPRDGVRTVGVDLERVMPRRTVEIKKERIFAPESIAYATDDLAECAWGAFHDATESITDVDALAAENPRSMFPEAVAEMIAHKEVCLQNTETALRETPRQYREIYKKIAEQARKKKAHNLGGHLRGLDETQRLAMRGADRSLGGAKRALAGIDAVNHMYEVMQQQANELGIDYRTSNAALERAVLEYKRSRREDAANLVEQRLEENNSHRDRIFRELAIPLYRTVPEGVLRVIQQGYDSKTLPPDEVQYLDDEAWLVDFGLRVETAVSKQSDTGLQQKATRADRTRASEDGVLEDGSQIDTVFFPAEIEAFLNFVPMITIQRQMRAASDASTANVAIGQQHLLEYARLYQAGYSLTEVMFADGVNILEQLDNFRNTLDEEEAKVLEKFNELAHKLRGDIQVLKDAAEVIFKEEKELAVHIYSANLDGDEQTAAELEGVVANLRMIWLKMFRERWPGTVEPLKDALVTVANRVQQTTNQRAIPGKEVSDYYARVAEDAEKHEAILNQLAPASPDQKLGFGRRAVAAILGRR